MAKRTKKRKARARAAAEARKFTAGKLLRLLLKSVTLAVVVSLLLLGLALTGLPLLQNTWAQMMVMAAVYVAAFPYVLSEFRPRRERGD